MDQSNAAARLLAILRKFPSEAHKRPGVTSIQIWMTILDANDNNFTERFSALNDLIKEIEIKIQADVNIRNKERYLRWVAPLRQLLSTPVLIASGHGYAGFFEDSASLIHTLEFVAEAFEKSFPETTSSKEDLDEIKNIADALFQAINEEITDPRFRAVLLELVEGIRHALSLYSIRGPIAIKESLERLTGALLFHKELLEENKSTAKKTLSNLWSIIEKASEFIGKTEKIVKAIEAGKAVVALFSSNSK